MWKEQDYKLYQQFNSWQNPQSELADSLKKDDKKLTLIDNRGIGKPDKFGGKDGENL